MDVVRVASVFVSALLVGSLAGVMALYANAIMPGLRKADDRTFVSGYQAIDTAIINPWFLALFLGGAVVTGVSMAVNFGERDLLPWLAVASVAYVGVIAITLTVHVPRNDEIKAAGDPEAIENLRAVRQAFDEELWVRWHALRTVLTFLSFGCLLWALVLVGG